MQNTLKAGPSGLFRIMQIADTQEIACTNTDTIRLIESALDFAHPDLVVFSGDQVKGYGVSMITGDVKAKTAAAINNIIYPLIKRETPFAFTFGNHDISKKCGRDFQTMIYKESGLCVQNFMTEDGGYSPFSYITVNDSNNLPAFNVYLFDTGKYDGVSAVQLDAYRKIRDKTEAPLYALAFCHIPPDVIYEKAVISDKKDKRAFKGAKSFSSNYYRLPDKLYCPGMFMGENFATVGRDDGLVRALCEKGDVMGLYFGHDHNNSFFVNYNGLDLGYTQGCGFNTYGPGLDRGVRIFDVDVSVGCYLTYCIPARILLSGKLDRPLTEYIYTHSPSSISTAVPFVLKRTAAAAAISAGAYVVGRMLKSFDKNTQ